MALVRHRRSDAHKSAGGSFVALRSTGIAFSAEFARRANLGDTTHVSLLVDDDARRLDFQFHSNKRDIDAYSLTVDGSAAADARWIQSRAVYKNYPWLGDVLSRPADIRRFEPYYDEKHKCWLIDIPVRPVRPRR